jgi:hypothetical protein
MRKTLTVKIQKQSICTNRKPLKKKKVKRVKQSHYRPGQAQRVPGS